MRNPHLRLSIVPACLAACGALHASELVVYEPFDYPASEPLTDLDGGSGWWSGWYEDGQALPASVRGEGLSYADALGNELHVSGLAADTSAASTTRSFRVVESEALNDVWISFLWHLPGSNSLFEGVTFYRGSQTLFTVSNPSTTTSSAIHLGTASSSTSTGRGGFGVTHFIVLRLAKGAGTNGNDRVEIFVDPLLTGNPSSPQHTLSGANFDFDTIRLAAQNGAPFYFDEFRVGTTFASITPHDPAPDGDSDGDGLSDAQEAILGTDPGVPNTELFAAIRTHPHFFGLYDAAGILQQGQGGVIIPKSGSSPVPFSFEIQQSENLLTWPQVETISRSIELPEGKNFLRVTLEK